MVGWQYNLYICFTLVLFIPLTYHGRFAPCGTLCISFVYNSHYNTFIFHISVARNSGFICFNDPVLHTLVYSRIVTSLRRQFFLFNILNPLLPVITSSLHILDTLDRSTKRFVLLSVISDGLKNASVLFTSRKEYDISHEFPKNPVRPAPIEKDRSAMEHIEKNIPRKTHDCV